MTRHSSGSTVLVKTNGQRAMKDDPIMHLVQENTGNNIIQVQVHKPLFMAKWHLIVKSFVISSLLHLAILRLLTALKILFNFCQQQLCTWPFHKFHLCLLPAVQLRLFLQIIGSLTGRKKKKGEIYICVPTNQSSQLFCG